MDKTLLGLKVLEVVVEWVYKISSSHYKWTRLDIWKSRVDRMRLSIKYKRA